MKSIKYYTALLSTLPPRNWRRRSTKQQRRKWFLSDQSKKTAGTKRSPSASFLWCALAYHNKLDTRGTSVSVSLARLFRSCRGSINLKRMPVIITRLVSATWNEPTMYRETTTCLPKNENFPWAMMARGMCPTTTKSIKRGTLARERREWQIILNIAKI